jgi:hypothetical protein
VALLLNFRQSLTALPDLKMSGLEVIGGISAVIGIIDASIKIYNSARKDLKLSETFKVVGQRLPVVLDTLQTCKTHLEPIKGSMPADACEALEKILDACDDKAGRLREIFEKVIPGESDGWEKRYLKLLKRSGKGRKVEELMISITEDVQLVVNNHAVKSATPEQNTELRDIIEEIKSTKSSVPEDEGSGMIFNSSGGNMENYINRDKGYLVVNREQVQTQHFGNGKN